MPPTTTEPFSITEKGMKIDIDPTISFKHGEAGDTVWYKSAIRTAEYDPDGQYTLLGVDVTLKRKIKTIIAKNIETGRILHLLEGDWYRTSDSKR